MQIERRMSTDRDAARAFAYLSDFETTTEWDPGTVRTVRESGDGGVGTRYRNTSRFLGRTTEVIYTVVELDPAGRIALRGENASLVARDTITVRPAAAGGSTVDYRAEFAFRGWVRLLRPVLALALERLGDRAARGMEEALAGR
ncbi:SRPBCC family protein [Ornithinimicrobium cavernae]|uniref:SRPBCC family protein n=1 Tax=Ornithinimicrobium cavernae TaxID=2666047 RepID=UPI000D6876C9|nr:SRPBCC family protein [Ornithinimicrobium cavernae]